MRHHSVRKLKYIVRFEKYIHCFEIGLSPKSLTHSQNKVNKTEVNKDRGILLKQNSTVGITISEKLLTFSQPVMKFESFSKSIL